MNLEQLHDVGSAGICRRWIRKEDCLGGITLKENGKHIGNIKIDPISKRHGTGEYGILIGDRNTWGKGYAAEATIGILKYCFQELGLRRITLEVIEVQLIMR